MLTGMTARDPVRWATAFLDVTAARQPAAERFWLAITGTRLSPRRGPGGEFVTLLPPSGEAYLRLQRVAAGPGGIHLDLHGPDPEALATRAVALGAKTTFAEPGLVVLRSPGGLAFCAVELFESGTVPEPVDLDGTRTRLDQVAVDCPPDRAAAELGFWAALTGWAQIPCQSPEFALLRPPEGTPRPLQLLIQRLDTGAAAGREPRRVTAHLDLAAGPTETHRRAAVAAHEHRGAVVQAEGRSWTVLRAPGGTTYCLTDRDPTTGLG